jgi:hypothetical protein
MNGERGLFFTLLSSSLAVLGQANVVRPIPP